MIKPRTSLVGGSIGISRCHDQAALGGQSGSKKLRVPAVAGIDLQRRKRRFEAEELERFQWMPVVVTV
jgi:hypothetical protein